MDALITFIAKYFILIPVLVNVYIFIKLDNQKRREMLVFLFFVGFLSILIAKIGAHIYNDPRPYISDNSAPLFAHSGDPNGFPSDHTLFSAYLAFVALYFSRKAGIFLLAVAVLVGWARVAAHVHHALDIFGSLIITALSYFIVVSLFNNSKFTRALKISRPQQKHHQAKD
jgi:membrane-associated phospholipid phosphatase